MLKKKILFYTAGTIIILFIFIMSVELVTRISSAIQGKGFTIALHELDPDDRRIRTIYRWHPFAGFVIKPNSQFVASHPSLSKTSVITVDRHGFISSDNALGYNKPANEVRIAIIGASTSANLHLGYDENWPGILEAMLRQQYQDKSIRIINAAVPGFNTAQSMANLSLRVMPFKPDIVIIYHAYNDLKAIRPHTVFKPDYTHIHKKPYGHREQRSWYISLANQSMAYVRAKNKFRESSKPGVLKDYGDRIGVIPLEAEETFKRNMRSLISIVKAGNATPVLSSFSTLHNLDLDYNNKKTLDKISRMQLRELTSLVQFTPGLKLETILMGIKRYNKVLYQLSRVNKIPWVDQAGKVPHDDRYFVDRVHFRHAGARKMAENYLPVVSKLVRNYAK